MPSSGTVSFTVNRDDIITTALQDIGAIGVGEGIAPEDLNYCALKLNMLVKQWQGQSDFSPGLKMWSRKRADLFLNKGQNVYNLGPSGDNWAPSNFITTGLTLAATGTSLSVASIVGMSSGDNIGIVLDTGNIFWTTINGPPGSNTITITTTLPSQASSGNNVYTYTTKARRPLQIITCSLRSQVGSDVPVNFMLLEEYEALMAKSNTAIVGDPLAIYYENHIDGGVATASGVLYLNVFPQDATKRLHMVYLSEIEDFNIATDTPDYPQNWYLALVYGLAINIAPAFQLPITSDLKELFAAAISTARNQDAETTGLYFQCGLDDRITPATASGTFW